MNNKVRRRKVKWFHKLATPMYEMEKPEGGMSLPEQMQQSFKSKNNYEIIDSYSNIKKEFEALLSKYTPHTPFGMAITALIGLMPKGHYPNSNSGFDMANLNILKSPESFMAAARAIAPGATKEVVLLSPAGEIAEAKDLSEDFLNVFEKLLIGDIAGAKSASVDTAFSAAIFFAPGILGKLVIYFKKAFVKLGILEEVVEEMPFEETRQIIEESANKKYITQDLKNTNEQKRIDSITQLNRDIIENVDIPRSKAYAELGEAGYRSYLENLPDKIEPLAILVSRDGNIRETYLVANPFGKKSIWYRSSGTGGVTGEGTYNVIHGITPNWYIKGHSFKTPDPNSIDADISLWMGHFAEQGRLPKNTVKILDSPKGVEAYNELARSKGAEVRRTDYSKYEMSRNREEYIDVGGPHFEYRAQLSAKSKKVFIPIYILKLEEKGFPKNDILLKNIRLTSSGPSNMRIHTVNNEAFKQSLFVYSRFYNEIVDSIKVEDLKSLLKVVKSEPGFGQSLYNNYRAMGGKSSDKMFDIAMEMEKELRNIFFKASKTLRALFNNADNREKYSELYKSIKNDEVLSKEFSDIP